MSLSTAAGNSMDLRSLLLTGRWPRRLTYPLGGLLLALGLPAGLMIIHAAFEHAMSDTLPATAWVMRELGARPLTYGYLLFAGILLLVLLGRMIGMREDQLEAMSITDALTGLANRRRLLG